ncbi:MAG: glutamyl-tRNA reductase [Acidobacteriota bacterium]
MDLVLVGLSHRTAPVEVRERIAFPEGHLPSALQRLRSEFGLREGMIVSTCNRVEIIAQGSDSRIEAIESVKNFLYTYHDLSPPFLENYLYSYLRHDVIRHVFRVASSLDSMVLGEPQILAQIKQAYALARQAESVGTQLKHLIPRAFFVAKKVRSATRIGASAVSISSVAVELARKIFGDLKGKSVLLLGAGEMGELAARSLVNSGINQILVANRTPDRSNQLASEFGGKTAAFEDLDNHLICSDIILVSTGSDSFLLDRNRLETIIPKRKYRPVFIIDIAVPRNVEPGVNELENVFLYDIDDLQSVMDANMRQRRQEAEVAEEIVEEEVRNYMQRLSTTSAGPLISALRRRIEDICLEELKNNQGSLSPEEHQRLEKILRRSAHKIAHPLINHIKQADDSPGRRLYTIDIIKRIFGLDKER